MDVVYGNPNCGVKLYYEPATVIGYCEKKEFAYGCPDRELYDYWLYIDP